MSVRSSVSSALREMLRRSGREVVPYDVQHFPDLHRQRLMQEKGINVVLDVGANMGQTGCELRQAGYTGRIVSFEPLSVPFAELKKQADADGNWQANQAAMGETAGSAQINVSGTHWSSSFLPMASRHESMVPQSVYTGVETVKVETVDRIFASAVRSGDRVMLKIDTQGFELPVLKGAAASLPQITIVQTELSLALLYEGQPKYYDVMKHLDESGFELANMIPAFFEKKTNQFLQADALFVRRSGS